MKGSKRHGQTLPKRIYMNGQYAWDKKLNIINHKENTNRNC